MLEQNAARLAPAATDRASAGPEPEERITIETRFGALDFGPENRLMLPVGLLGFSDCRHFGLAQLPQAELAQYRLLQSLDDHSLGFIVTTLKLDEGIVAREDLEDAALSVGIPVESAAFLLIVTVRPTPEGSSVTVNLRAPVVVDINRAVARQVVMANSSYPIQQPIQLLRQA
jgi:flagellar assembly factor FliW